MQRCVSAVAGALLIFISLSAHSAEPLPNILWLSTEDIGPHVGCCGDEVAKTPHLDRLAEQGTVYDIAWSTCPVCAPARTTIITGVYPAATGGEHMRSNVPLPEGIRMFPEYLREAGYYCTNSSKEDYNHPKTTTVWDASAGKAHWKNRKPGQPFFAVFNYTATHESRIRKKGHELVTDPAAIQVPAYHPDQPEIRRDWAQYYDNIAVMDGWVQQKLDELKQAGLWEETIIVFFGDHGSGMPRNKRYPGNSGLLVPFVVRVPAKYKALVPDDYAVGGHSSRPVGFIDLAPTMLSLAGIQPPDYMQGHAFMGAHTAKAPEYLYGFRGRMDERVDLVRSLRDQRYLYLRNYLPHRPHGQHVNYQFQTISTWRWKELYDAGECTPEQAAFWTERSPEELYDLASDPDGVHNLASSAEHQAILDRFRNEHRRQALAIRDVLLLPEGQMAAIAEKQPPYAWARDKDSYPLEQILDIAGTASRRDETSLDMLLKAVDAPNPTVRYWAVTGLLVRGEEVVQAHVDTLTRLLGDASANVRIQAAEALCRYGDKNVRDKALNVLLKAADMNLVNQHEAVAALNAIDNIGPLSDATREAVRNLPTRDPKKGRGGGYVSRLVQTIGGGE